MAVTLWLTAIVLAAALALFWVRRRSTSLRWRRLLGRRRDGAERPGRILVPLRLTHRRATVPLAVAVGGLVGLILAGPVAAGVATVYGATGTAIVRWWRRQRRDAASRRAAVDAVAGFAAELRAGLGVAAAMAAAASVLSRSGRPHDPAASIAGRVHAAIEVAESSGAPLAEVLDRLDVHLRAVDRARAAADAQAAGARASALMLAALPVAGIGLGVAVGIDPFDLLLHTPLGAACLAGAVVLQLGGLAWAARLTRLEVSP